MAEGGDTLSAVKSKPVPPPKPSCSPAKHSSDEPGKAFCSARGSVCTSPSGNTHLNANIDPRSEEIASNTKKKDCLQIKNTATSNVKECLTSDSHIFGRDSVPTKHLEQPSRFGKGIKPPLLPKPQTSHLVQDSPQRTSISEKRHHGVNTLPSGLRISCSPSSRDKHFSNLKIKSTETEKLNKVSKELFLSSSFADDHSVGNGNVKNTRNPVGTVTSSSLFRKAPVAKLDEFDNLCEVNPIRPPRSPKIKEFVGGPFAKCNNPKPQLPIKNKFLSNASTVHHDIENESKTYPFGIGALKLDKNKSASLGRSRVIHNAMMKSKTCSLERNNLENIKQLVESQGSSSSVQSECSPIPPPRRRKKSVTDPAQSPDTSPVQQIAPEFNTKSLVPVYAQVNYSLKRNRRSDPHGESSAKLETSSLNCEFPLQQERIESEPVEENTNENCTKSSVSHDNASIILSENTCTSVVTKSVGVANECLILDNSCSEVAVLDLNANCSLQCVTENKLSSLVPSSPLKVEVMCSDSFTEIDNTFNNASTICSDKAVLTEEEHIHSVECAPSSPVPVDKFSDLHTQVEARDDTCDDSLSSSKLEWQSVASSFLNSGSDIALEILESECLDKKCDIETITFEHVESENTVKGDIAKVFANVDSSIKNAEQYLHSLQDDVNVSEEEIKDGEANRNNNMVSDMQSVDFNENSKFVDNAFQDCIKVSDLNCSVIEAHKSSLLSITIKNNTDIASSSQGKVHNKNCNLFSSSLPSNIKQNKRIFRRQSWSSSKDHSPSFERELLFDWQKCKHSGTLWLDEGELSSGTLADLDSSDNAARQSSFEEVNMRSSATDNPHRTGRKFMTWWGSFGKSNKKHRGSKRLSHFYCERQGSSGSDDQALKSSYEDNSSSTMERISTPLPCAEVTPPDLRENPKSCDNIKDETMKCVNSDQKNETPVSEESFENDPHSDSEIDDVSGACNVKLDNLHLSEQNNEKKAFYIAQELMTSERDFINVLRLLNINFKNAVEAAGLEQCHPVIPESDFYRILNSLPQLQRFNEDLLRDLEQRIENWASILKIADIIVKKGPFLKLYTTYIQNFEAQCNYFDDCCQKYPKFAKVVRDFETLPLCRKLSVKHFMLKPVQRIPQYRLLLDDYFSHLKPSSPDYDDTQTALRIVSDVADHANRSIKLGDHLSKLLQLQSQLGNYEIIKPGRIYLKGGELFKLSRKDRQPRYFILLNDCLLYTSYYGSGPASGLKVNSELPLGGMKVSTPQAEDYHNEFSIISSTRSFTLSARSLTERQEWVDALQNAIKEHTSRQLSFQNQKLNLKKSDGSFESFKLGKEAPVWIQDGRVTKCQSCIAEFTVTFRRHHCRACGKVVCGSCSEYRAPLQYMKFQAARVCEECYNSLLKEFENPATNIHDAIKSELAKEEYTRDSFENIRSHFKKLGPGSGKKTRKYVPQRLLEVTANDTGSNISGWLQRRTKRSWKRFWFVLKEQVLYVYKACEDVVALETIPVLGYKVEPMKERHFQLYEGIDARFVFQLTHCTQLTQLQPLVFSADSEHSANRWIAAMLEATVLK